MIPLHQAFMKGHHDVVKLLLDAGADPNQKMDSGFKNGGGSTVYTTLLCEAANRGQQDMVKVLLDAGADPNLRADNGDNPLGLAAMGGHADMVKLLLEAGADPSGKSDRSCKIGYAKKKRSPLNRAQTKDACSDSKAEVSADMKSEGRTPSNT